MRAHEHVAAPKPPEPIPRAWAQPIEDVIAVLCIVQREAHIAIANTLTRRFVLAITPTAIEAWRQADPNDCATPGCPCRHEALLATVADARTQLTAESRPDLTKALFARLDRYFAERN